MRKIVLGLCILLITNASITAPVSYTHLDVYKRQSNTCFNKVCVNTPTLTAVTPNMGPTTGSAVTLNGTSFFPVGMAATSVTFGGVAGTVPNVTAATTATTTTPARLNMIGLVNVVLTLPGNHVYTLNNGFKYYYGQLAFNNAVASGSNLTTQYSGMVLVCLLYTSRCV